MPRVSQARPQNRRRSSGARRSLREVEASHRNDARARAADEARHRRPPPADKAALQRAHHDFARPCPGRYRRRRGFHLRHDARRPSLSLRSSLAPIDAACLKAHFDERPSPRTRPLTISALPSARGRGDTGLRQHLLAIANWRWAPGGTPAPRFARRSPLAGAHPRVRDAGVVHLLLLLEAAQLLALLFFLRATSRSAMSPQRYFRRGPCRIDVPVAVAVDALGAAACRRRRSPQTSRLGQSSFSSS